MLNLNKNNNDIQVNKRYYVVCPLYKAKKRLKVADRRHKNKICKYEILECEVLVHRKELDDVLVNIIDNEEQHKYTHHKYPRYNKIYISDSDINQSRYNLEALLRVSNENVKKKSKE